MPETLPSPISVVFDDTLDPGSRALLDLTLRHGVSDEQLAEVVGADATDIADRRERAIDEVIARAGVEPAPALDPETEAEKGFGVSAVAERMLAEAREAFHGTVTVAKERDRYIIGA